MPTATVAAAPPSDWTSLMAPPRNSRSPTVTTISVKAPGSLREIRAAAVQAAQLVAEPGRRVVIEVSEPRVAERTIRSDWETTRALLRPHIAREIILTFVQREGSSVQSESLPLPRPNFRFEVLRALINAASQGSPAVPVGGLQSYVGGSQSALRPALAALEAAGLVEVCSNRSRRLAGNLGQLTPEALSRLDIGPPILRFRLARGASTSLDRLAARAELLVSRGGPFWVRLAVSGVLGAKVYQPDFDLRGIPRLDLAFHAGGNAPPFSVDAMRLLDDGLEVEPNPLADAPVAVMVFHGAPKAIVAGDEQDSHAPAGIATPADIWFSLRDAGLHEQAASMAMGW
jgi:DNA-binding transcriptional ArsR family regulator